MEVLYYFICSVKDNVPFILSNRANEIIQYLHNMVAVHPATSGFITKILSFLKLSCLVARAKQNQKIPPSKKEVPQEWVTLRPGLLTGWTLSTNQLESRTKSHTYSWGLLSWGFVFLGYLRARQDTAMKHRNETWTPKISCIKWWF